jgi:PAS domain S-box-containing protein
MGWRLGARSIQGELALFVALLVLPLVAVIAYLLQDRARHDVADAEAVVRRLADNGNERAARLVEEARATLEAVARRPLVRAMDPARCDPDLRHLLELYPRASNFLVVDRTGRILCGAIPPPPGRVVRIKDEGLLARILETRRFGLSRPVVGNINKRWSLAAVQPVFGDDDTVVGTVSMSIDLLAWQPFPAVDGLPGDTILSLLSGGVVIARSADAAKWVGQDVSRGEIMRHVRDRKQGVVRAAGVAGVDRIWAFRPVHGTDWTVLAGIRADEVLGPVARRSLEVALLVALLVAAVIALAIAFARRLARPVQRIAATLRLRAAGEAGVPFPVSGPREIAAVAEELNRAERTLRESEERFRALWDASTDAILMIDEASVIRYANPAVQQVFGYGPEALVGQDIALLQPPALAQAHREGLARYLRAGDKRVDWRAMLSTGRRRDGTEFPVEMSFSELRLEGRRYFAGFLTDVTERERARQRLALAQRLFAALSEVNETIVRVRERDELFREVCRIAVERLGFLLASVGLVDAGRLAVVPHVYAGPSSGVLRGYRLPLDPADPLSNTVTASAVRTRRAAVANDVDADPSKAAARPIRARVGSRSTAAFPLFQAGEVIGALTVHAAEVDFFEASVVELLTRMADDISFALDKFAEQHQLAALTRELEQRVSRRTAELQAANEELEAFSYSVSHDLRAPVRHIDGFAQLLGKELQAPGTKAAHYLATIAAAARRMGALIDDLLQLSRTGRQPLALRRVDLAALVRELVHEAAPEIGAREVDWEVEELPAVLADPALLRILLQNLLSNALKYSRSRPRSRIAIRARPAPGGIVEISVRDNGVGFDPRFKDKLFGVFQRLHRDEEFEGTGIGLATARRIAHRHGQRIWGEGAPGEGATFTFTMAAAQAEAQT